MGVVWRLASATSLIVLAFSMAAPVLPPMRHAH
jgi:hypothetical protein